jgi:plasmid maintenance system antidote protein VapI
MTLKEKFTEILYKQSHDDSECLRIRFENIDKVVDSQKDIADDFAIGFKDWCDNEGRFVIGTNTTKELLEIYKKEKGL